MIMFLWTLLPSPILYFILLGMWFTQSTAEGAGD